MLSPSSASRPSASCSESLESFMKSSGGHGAQERSRDAIARGVRASARSLIADHLARPLFEDRPLLDPPEAWSRCRDSGGHGVQERSRDASNS